MFFRDTLNKNPKDRNILLKIEKDLMEFVQENRLEHTFYLLSIYFIFYFVIFFR